MAVGSGPQKGRGEVRPWEEIAGKHDTLTRSATTGCQSQPQAAEASGDVQIFSTTSTSCPPTPICDVMLSSDFRAGSNDAGQRK